MHWRIEKDYAVQGTLNEASHVTRRRRSGLARYAGDRAAWSGFALHRPQSARTAAHYTAVLERSDRLNRPEGLLSLGWRRPGETR